MNYCGECNHLYDYVSLCSLPPIVPKTFHIVLLRNVFQLNNSLPAAVVATDVVQ